MVQAIFFSLLILTLLAGTFAYFNPSQKPINPLGFMMDKSGYTDYQTLNTKRIQEINLTTSNGTREFHKLIDDLALEQSKFLDTIQNQQEVLNSANKDASDILLEAQKTADKNDKDILQLETLTSEIQNEQRLLVSQGQDLVSLNDQLTDSRQSMAEKLFWANISTDSALHALQQRYIFLNNQAADFFDKVNEYNQQACDQIDQLRSKLHDMFNNATYTSTEQQQKFKDRIQQMLDREHDSMTRLSDSQQRNREVAQDTRDNIEYSKEQLNDSLQRTRDMIEDERQRAEDQQVQRSQ